MANPPDSNRHQQRAIRERPRNQPCTLRLHRRRPRESLQRTLASFHSCAHISFLSLDHGQEAEGTFGQGGQNADCSVLPKVSKRKSTKFAKRYEKREAKAQDKRDAAALRAKVAGAADVEEAKIPRSMVIHSGSVGKYVKRLEKDIRRVMLPFTAKDLQVKKQNAFKDFLVHAVENYSLCRDVLSAIKRPVHFQALFDHSPLVVLNGFNDPKRKHLKLVQTVIQNMFPSINVDTVNLQTIRRAVLVNFDAETETVDFRHYSIKTVPSELSKSAKKLVQSKIPDLSKYKDISDFLMNPGQLSESEFEGEQVEMELPQDLKSRGCRKGMLTKLRLMEIGPRMTLKLTKIEEGVDQGNVLFHAHKKQKSLVFFSLACFVLAVDVPEVDELRSNFELEAGAIRNVGTILESMKRLAFHQHFGGRRGSHDFDVAKMLDASTKKQKPNAVSPLLVRSEPDALWTGDSLPIRYRFHDSLEPFTIRLIVEAVEFWQSNTCINFLLDDKAKRDHVQFFKGSGCYSSIGRLGGRQAISIGAGCERILPTYISDFELRGADEITTLGIPYDYGSVMQYASTAFSIDGKSITLLTKDERYQQTIGQRERPSFYDVAIINRAYCPDACVDDKWVVACSNGGYPHPRQCSKCICPDGLGGNQCRQNEEPKNAECGDVLKANSSWQTIEAPPYEEADDGQKCSWLIRAPKGRRIKIQFEELSFPLLDHTGPRYCCNKLPSAPLISDGSQVIVIFRSLYSDDRSFPAERDLARRMAEPPATTTKKPSLLKQKNQWAEWGDGHLHEDLRGLRIKTRTRECLHSCIGRSQEFATCNFKPCPPNPACNRTLLLHRLCEEKKICTSLADELADCDKPACCPPFLNVGGECVNDEQKISFG
ncbi:CBR-NAS-36 protein [Aphelenchoides fujianensis]|nr:CBR-NAS-36 protein [Aphelenchoides fujianensis]